MRFELVADATSLELIGPGNRAVLAAVGLSYDDTYFEPGPLTQEPVTIAIDDPMTVNWPPPL